MSSNTEHETPPMLQPWQTPTLECHGALEQLTRSTGSAGPGDGLFTDANS